MDKTKALQKLLDGTASEEEINLLKGLLASGEISIGGNVNHSVIIIGSGNTVELTPEALDRLNARPLLGDLDRDLTRKEITLGLERLESELPLRAPVLLTQFQEQTRRLRPSLKTQAKSLSDHARKERVEALAVINSLCVEALDISFNALCLGEEPPEYDSRSPFRGLESFRPEDSEFFFGREALTRKLIGKINAHSFLAVLGASGSGKSSLVMAGLIPALGLDYAIFRPGTDPLGALESAKEKALIVVDQFEELFTLTRDESTRVDFIAKLLEVRQKIVITLRSDFLGEVGAYRALSEEIQSHLEIVPPMDMDELRRAMEGQAGVVGLRFEADLSQQILDDVEGEPGAMPLLQHALWELWNRRHGRWLRASEYRAFGGVKQAITSTAEKVYADCSNPEQEQMRDIFLRLTRLDDSDEGRDTRRRVPLGDLIPSGRDAASITLLLDKLANARLIVKTVNADKTEVEVAHEALIRHWERLRLWLNEDRDNLRLREGVSEDARRWENSGRDETLLNHRGGRLDDALEIGENSRYGFTEIEQAYLNACVALRNREQRERERRLRYTVVASIAAAIVFLVLGSFGWVKSNEATARANDAATAQAKAEEQTNIALSRQLATQAQSIFSRRDSKQQTAVLLAIQSMRMFTAGQAEQILQDNTLVRPSARMTHDGVVSSVAFSPDGKYVVSRSRDDIYIWEVETGKEITRIRHGSTVSSVAFSPDSKYVASGGCDQQDTTGICTLGTSRVWEVATGKEIGRMAYNDDVTSVAFSPNGKYVVSGGCDQRDSNICIQGSARVWEIATGKEIARETHDSWVNSVAFSPDSRYIVSGGCDQYQWESNLCSKGSVRVWETSTGKEIARMEHNSWVNSVAFSPDSNYVVSGGCDQWDSSLCTQGSARVWEAETGKEIARMMNNSYVRSVAFSPNGRYIVSGGCEQQGSNGSCLQGSARILEVATGKEIVNILYDDKFDDMSYDNSVLSVEFSADGKYVLTRSNNNSARVWDAATGKEIASMIHNSLVTSVAFSPDGKYVVSGSEDGVYIWDAVTRNEVARMTHTGSVISFAFSPNGKYVASGGEDATLRVWDFTTGKEIARIQDNYFGNGFIVTSLAFSPEGKYVVFAIENTVRVREVTTGVEVTRMNYDVHASSVAFSPDGKYVVTGGCDQQPSDVCAQGSARVWEALTGKEISRMTHDGNVSVVAFSPDGKYIVSGGDNTARVWEVLTGKEISRMMHDARVTSVAFSPNGNYLISGSIDKTVRIWESTTGKEIVRMNHDNWVYSVAFSPDGKYVASGGLDGTSRIWDADTGKEIARITYGGVVDFVAFSPNGKYAVSAGCYQFFPGSGYGYCETGIVQAWIYRPNDLISDACSRVTRNLTRAEWKQYIGDALPYQAICPNLPLEP